VAPVAVVRRGGRAGGVGLRMVHGPIRLAARRRRSSGIIGMRLYVLTVGGGAVALGPVVPIMARRHVDTDRAQSGMSHILRPSGQCPSGSHAHAADHEATREGGRHL
jgi:hypothetical protein